jgi:hypothetical protein
VLLLHMPAQEPSQQQQQRLQQLQVHPQQWQQQQQRQRQGGSFTDASVSGIQMLMQRPGQRWLCWCLRGMSCWLASQGLVSSCMA